MLETGITLQSLQCHFPLSHTCFRSFRLFLSSEYPRVGRHGVNMYAVKDQKVPFKS